jgi:hypothetical protein
MLSAWDLKSWSLTSVGWRLQVARPGFEIPDQLCFLESTLTEGRRCSAKARRWVAM